MQNGAPTSKRLPALCGLALLAAGCNFSAHLPGSLLPRDDRPLVVEESGDGDTTGVSEILAQGEWVQRIVRDEPGSDATDSAPASGRWRHGGLESILVQSDARARLKKATRSSDKTISGNAAIGLAWLGDESALPALIRTARDLSLKLPARGAAIEAIGRLNTAKADAALDELLQAFGEFLGPGRSGYVPELHEDLVRAIAGREPARFAGALQKALRSPSAAVRLQAASSYLLGDLSAPGELVDCTADDSAVVRAAAVRALAQSRHDQAQSCAWRALNDYDLSVRLAAIEALGVLPAAENAARLHELAEDSADVIRAASVKSLARRGDVAAIPRAVNDPSWRVRSAAAEQLQPLPAAQRMPLARGLLSDASLEVQRQTVRALADWPLEESVELLLVAMEGSAAATRRQAAEQLQRRWPAAAELTPSAPRERLIAEAARLRDLWGQRPSHAQPAGSARTAVLPTGQAETPWDAAALTRLYATIAQLGEVSVQKRRAAARELAREYPNTALPAAALSQLSKVVERESDSLVWHDVLSLVARDGRAPAADIAAVAASHTSPEVRRRACVYFAQHEGTRATAVLENCLVDENQLVVREALHSLAQQQTVPNLSKVEPLMDSADGEVRLLAATALARHGSEAGVRAIMQMTHHQDPVVRRQAARTLGTLFRGPPESMPKPRVAHDDALRSEVISQLVRLLDDRGDVRRDALASLHQIASETTQPADDSAEQIRRWKESHAARQK